MKRGNEKWVNSMKERLDRYVEPVPESVWKSLEQEISAKTLPSSFNWKRMASAAAVVFITLASVSIWMLDFSEEKEPFRQIVSCSEQISEMNKYAEVDALPVPVVRNEKKTIGVNKKVNNQLTAMRENKVLTDESFALQNKKEYTEISSVDTDTLPESDKQKQVSLAEKKKKATIVSTDKYGLNVRHFQKRKANWELGLAYANSLGVRNASFHGYTTLNLADYSQVKEPLRSDALMPHQNKAPQKEPTPINSNSELPKTEIKHKLPVTAGISFRYYINRQFAIETGLNYTMLSSELRAGTHDEYYVEEYKYHYLGIPLKASWTFLDIPYLSLYLSAGGEMEKSLAGKYKKKYISKDEDVIVRNDNIKPVQWSILGGLGIQLKLNSHVGIYAEPGVVYYFDDGSKVQTIRKEKPFNFKMQLGIRWTY